MFRKVMSDSPRSAMQQTTLILFRLQIIFALKIFASETIVVCCMAALGLLDITFLCVLCISIHMHT